MECPKCGFEIDEKALVCPNCKKVLKLVCPICKTVNTSNTCKRCGYVIVSKCTKCGKINQTISKTCKKCGFPTEKSVILNEANTDDFAMLIMQFPNIDNMKKILGSIKLYNRFKVNLDTIINEICKSKKIRRQIYKDTYVIRFDKDYSFKASVENSIKTTIEIFNRILTMNAKLSAKKNSSVRCNAFLVKRSVNDAPDNIDVGYNISLLHNETGEEEQKILNTYQLISEAEIADLLSNEYKTSVLTNSFSQDVVKTFYEIDISEKLNFNIPDEFDENEIEVPNFVQNMLVEQENLKEKASNDIVKANDPDAIYDMESINFEELRCAFIRTRNVDLSFHLLNAFQNSKQNIIGIRANDLYKPYSVNILNTVEQSGLFKNIITISCYDEMKYTPYAFFTMLISKVFDYAISTKLLAHNDYSVFDNIDGEGIIRELISMNTNTNRNFADTRYNYFNIFLTLFQAIPESMIIVEDFEKIDASSYEALKYFFNNFEQSSVSFILTYDKDYALHKDMHFLINTPYYTEIMLKPVQFEDLIRENKDAYKEIMDSFYFQRIAKYACGSTLYLDTAVQYLLEADVFKVKKDVVYIADEKTIIIPSTLDKLIERRINLLQDDANASKLLIAMILLSSSVDMKTLEILNLPDMERCLTKLQEKGFIYIYNNSVNFPNYNILRRSLLNVVSPIYLKETVQIMLERVFAPEVPSYVKSYLYEILGDDEKIKSEWESLTEINLKLGDFNAYMNCVQKVLDYLNTVDNSENSEQINSIRNDLCLKIAENMLEYIPQKSQPIAMMALSNLEKSGNAEGVINLCNRMIQGDMNYGYYMNALELTHKILSLLPPSSLSCGAPNFNQYFFMMSLLHIQILFNIGALNECLNVGYRVLSEVKDGTINQLKPEMYGIDDFISIVVDAIAYIALANILTLQGNIKQFMDITRGEFSRVPSSYALFIQLEAFLHGSEIDVEMFNKENDIFAQIFYNILKAFTLKNPTAEVFAGYIYKSKVLSHGANLHSIELFADLMIAYAYMIKKNYVKAKDIIYKVIKDLNTKGITLILYVAWLLLADIYIESGKYDVAFGIVNNSLIQLEKNSSTGDYLLMLYKYRMYKIMMYKKDYERASICIGQAKYIASKYGIYFVFDENPEHYVARETNEVLQDDSAQAELDENLSEMLKEREG